MGATGSFHALRGRGKGGDPGLQMRPHEVEIPRGDPARGRLSGLEGLVYASYLRVVFIVVMDGVIIVVIVPHALGNETCSR